MKNKPTKKRNGYCTKIRYSTKRDARDALNKHGKDMGILRYYKCNICTNRETWHLTSRNDV